MQLVVTGYMLASDVEKVAAAMAWAARGRPGPHTLFHGGRDDVAVAAARQLGWGLRRFKADWTAPCRKDCAPGHRKQEPGKPDYCPAAHVYRDEAKIAAGPDAVLVVFKRGAGNRTASRAAGRIKKYAHDAGVTVMKKVI